MRSLIAAVRFLTRLPLPGRPTAASELRGALLWFPVVGAGVGWLIAGAGVLALGWWSPAVAWLVAIGFGLLLTGAFHEDAVADSADALGGGFTTDKVQEILHDSRIGSYGSAALWLLLALRWSLLLNLGELALWVYPLACAWGRWSALPLMCLLPPGPASRASREVAGGPGRLILLGASGWVLSLLLLFAWLGPGWPLALASLAALPALTCWWWYLRVRLGWQSGDLLGAGNQLVEIAVLLAVLAWRS